MKKILNALKGNGCQARMLTAAMAVLSAMAGLTSCANEDTALDNTTARTAEGRTVEFTATLAPKGEAQPVLAEGEGDNGGQTRAITVNDQNTANETLNVAWQKDEEIAVYYEKTNGEHATATATVGAPNDDGSAPITATLPDAKAGTAKFVYPATLHDGQGDINESKFQNQQVGKLTEVAYSISNRFDAATGSGTISISDGNATTSGNISLANKCCICKFKINLSGSGIENYFKIMIAFKGSHTYTILTGGSSLNGFYVAMLPETSADCTITAMGYNDQSYSGNPSVYLKSLSSVTLEAGKFYNNVPITLTQTEAIKTLSGATYELTLQDGDIVTGTGGGNTQLKIAADATVTLLNLTNTSIINSKSTSFPGIECLGNATIILAGENSVKGVWGKAGIYVPEGKTLTIRGGGTLTATANVGAGIGGNTGVSCGNIVIEGGNINATGANRSAGIGCGDEGSCGNITITGGNITATGDGCGAGIGSGLEGSCGDISISGSAQVTATGGDKAAGIGSGHAGQATNTCGDISISGSAQVTATGGTYAAGIGSGNGINYSDDDDNHTLYVSSCGTISITGGTIKATGGVRAAGIGSGSDGKFTSISIGSGITSVTATRSNDYRNAPIGKGNDDRGNGAVTFDGVVMHNGTGDASQSNWAQWPEKGGPFGGIKVSASNYGSNGKTWTLTPSN
ncbi:MAG: carbohydrate-binding domain-containing protein [Prevotella sp.]|nr:carbohydrate-binding domain-containing protein [Prevotella sp.]